jgi:hypothetical protein
MATMKRSQMVRYDKVFFLMSSTITRDEDGNQIPSYSEKKVFGRELNVSDSAFYNAAAAGLRPEKQLETYAVHYSGQQKLKYEGIVYSIIRTRNNGDKVILVCERVLGNG